MGAYVNVMFEDDDDSTIVNLSPAFDLVHACAWKPPSPKKKQVKPRNGNEI